ncbi:LPD38 domain-containing protein [Paenibacillus sp. FSL R10-2782]|uniref:LPD38 domain-containing protein n=1 Tax=Paenibacillus sp. FSL R10-2782 TaxID=2954661 RepID=UPI0031598734
MASKYDAVRNRRQQGEEARARVLARASNPNPVGVGSESKYAAVRNRTADIAPPTLLNNVKNTLTGPAVQDFVAKGLDYAGKEMQQKAANREKNRLKLPPALVVGPGFIENSTFAQATQGNRDAIGTYRAATGRTIKPLTQYEQNLEEINKAAAEHPFYGEHLAPLSRELNWLTEGNPVGRFIGRATTTGAEMSLGKASTMPTTGNATADNVADKLGMVGGVFGMAFNPAAPGVKGQNLLTGPMAAAEGAIATRTGNAAVNAISRQASKLPGVSSAAADRVTRGIATGAATGAIGNTAYGLNMDQSTGEEVLHNAALGAAFGAGGEVVARGVGAGWRSLFKKNGIPDREVSEILSLPVGRKEARINSATARSVQQAGDEAIANPFTFTLPEGSPQTRRATANAAEGRGEIQQINSRLQELESQYGQRVIDEYKYLKQSRDSRGGVSQGQLQRGLDGDVIGRTGRTSQNPLWYQEFYQTHGKAPSNNDLYKLAQERVDNGFMDESGRVPSWRETSGFDEQLAAYTAARDNLRTGVQELDPALRVTDQPLVSSRLKQESSGLRVNESSINKQETFSVNDPAVPEFMRARQARQEAAKGKQESVAPENSPIKPDENYVLPKQYEEQNGLGISAFAQTKPYDSLSTSTRSQLVTRQMRDPRSLKGSSDRLYTALVDDAHPYNLFDRMVEKVLGRKLDASESTHKLALASRGSDMVAKQIVTDKMVNSAGEVVGDSLKDVLSTLPGGKNAPKVESGTRGELRSRTSKTIYVDFEDYLINKHAITRWDRGEKVFADKLEWTPEKGQKIVDEYERLFPEFVETADNLYKFNQNLVNNWLVDTGVISKEMAETWFHENPYYVPNKRYFTSLEKRNGAGGKAKQGYGNQSNPVKGYSKGGSQKKIISPIEATIENVDAYVKTAKRNQVMQQFVKNLNQDAEAFKDIATVVVSRDIGKEKLAREILEENGLDKFMQSLDEDYARLRRDRLDTDNTVRVLMNGDPVRVKVHDAQTLDAVTSLGPQGANAVMDAIGWLTNKMKTLTTGANPVFSLTRNLFRDIPQAYVASKTTNNPVRFIVDLADASVQILRNGELYKRYKRIGGGHSSPIAADRNLLKQSKREVLPKSMVKDLGPRLYYGLENIMNAVESAPRLAEFKRVAKGGAPEDIQKALFAAQDVTVNFKRRGKLVRDLDKAFPYMNAALQGLDQFVRVYKDNPAKATMKAVLALTIPSIVTYVWNHDDPNYQKLSNRIKDSFILIPKGDGTFIKIAKPQELGTLFSDLPERLLRKFQDDDPAAFRDFADRIRTTFTPPGVQGALKEGGIIDRLQGMGGETILGPVPDLAANKTFSGSPIVPGYLQNLSPELQTDAKTTKIATWLGEKTGTSPKQLDYLARQYTGFIGQFGQPLLSPGGDFGNALIQQVTTDPVFSNDISTEFYKYKEKLDQVNYDSDLRKPPAWYDDSLRKKMTKISKEMGAIRKDVRAVQDDESISNKEKRARLRALQEKINQLAEGGNELARGKVPY